MTCAICGEPITHVFWNPLTGICPANHCRPLGIENRYDPTTWLHGSCVLGSSAPSVHEQIAAVVVAVDRAKEQRAPRCRKPRHPVPQALPLALDLRQPRRDLPAKRCFLALCVREYRRIKAARAGAQRRPN